MNWKKTALWLAGILLPAALWLHWWLRPERQIPRAQARLLSSIERRDFAAMAALLAPDYRDRWQQDKATLLGRSREAFGSFALLTIGHELRGLRAEAGSFSISEKITIKGIGAPSAMAVRETVNALREPFTMEWRRRNEKPWDWELKSVAQPELELP